MNISVDAWQCYVILTLRLLLIVQLLSSSYCVLIRVVLVRASCNHYIMQIFLWCLCHACLYFVVVETMQNIRKIKRQELFIPLFHNPLPVDAFWLRKITTDHHILAHVNIVCPDDTYSKLVICNRGLILDGYEYIPVACVTGPSGLAVCGVRLRPLLCWDFGFESHRGHGCLLWASCFVT